MRFETGDDGKKSNIRSSDDPSARLSVSNGEMAVFQARLKANAAATADCKPVYGDGWSWADAPDIYAKSADFYGKDNVVAQAERGNLETSETFSTPLNGSEIANHAKALGELHRDWWKNEGSKEEIRKCNLYADRVYRDMHVPLPWESAHIPTVHGMKEQLAKSPGWESVYTSGADFSKYKPHPGDFILWDKTIPTIKDGHPYPFSLEHCGVIGNDGVIHYAGSRVDHGYAESNFQSMCASESYGAPSLICRSKHLQS